MTRAISRAGSAVRSSNRISWQRGPSAPARKLKMRRTDWRQASMASSYGQPKLLRPNSTVAGPSRTRTSTRAFGNKVVAAAIPSVVGERSISRKSLTGPSSSGPGSAKRSSAVPICIAKRDGPPRRWNHQSSQLSATDRQKFSNVSLLARKKSSGTLGFPTLRMERKQVFQVIRSASGTRGQQYYRIVPLRLVMLRETIFRPLAIVRWPIRGSGRVQPC